LTPLPQAKHVIPSEVEGPAVHNARTTTSNTREHQGHPDDRREEGFRRRSIHHRGRQVSPKAETPQPLGRHPEAKPKDLHLAPLAPPPSALKTNVILRRSRRTCGLFQLAPNPGWSRRILIRWKPRALALGKRSETRRPSGMGPCFLKGHGFSRAIHRPGKRAASASEGIEAGGGLLSCRMQAKRGVGLSPRPQDCFFSAALVGSSCSSDAGE